MSKLFHWAELPPRTDVYTYAGTTRWGNHDLYPIPKREKTYGWLSYFAFWITAGMTVTDYSTASAYIAYGLNAGQTIGAVLIGPGLDQSLGYTMMVRVGFGMWGSMIPYAVVIIGGIVFSGLQAYYGGQAVTLIIGAVIPQFHHLKNTLHTSAGITTQNLIGFLIYFVLYLPIVFYIPPHKIKKFLYPSFIIITATMFGILGWAVHANHGTGNLVASHLDISSASKAFRMIQCASSVGGSWAGAAERFSDWTRFSRSRNAPIAGMMFALPISVTLASAIGVLVTSATSEIYGELMWNPLTLLAYVQENNYTPACRAGTFFAGCGILSSQIFLNLTQNTVPWGMDMAGCIPRYLSMKRGAVILCICTILDQPWRFLGQAYVFVEVLSVLSIFVGASTLILIADYWIIRRQAWKVPDLYKDGSEGIYWYTRGWNWRAVVALILGMWPAMPGLVFSISGQYDDTNAWVRIFQVNYFLGAPIGFIVFIILNLFWPPRGLGVQEDLEEEELPVIEGGSSSIGVKERSIKETTRCVVIE